ARGAIGRERLRVELVERGEVALHVGEEHRDVHDVLPGRTRVLEHEPDVLEHCSRLSFNVVRVDARDRLRSARPRPDPREEQEVADALGVREGTDGLRRPRALEVAAAAHPFTGIATVFGSVKKWSASVPPSRPTPLALMPPNGTRRSRCIHVFTHTTPV